MRKPTVWIAAFCVAGAALAVLAQQSDVIIKIEKGDRAVLAVPDLRGSGEMVVYEKAEKV